MLDSNYLEKIASKSANHNNEQFGFSKFEDINVYLIQKTLKENFNLWLDVKDDLDKYYQPVVFALVINFFEKNVSRTYNLRNNLNTNVRVGKKYEKGKKVYEVIEVMTDNDGREKVKLRSTAKGSDEITMCYLEYFDEYVEVDEDAGSRPTLIEMGKLMKNIGYNKIIASYAHKFAIVCSKKHFENNLTSKFLKALPYEYITKTETLKPNKPLKDFMFFVVNNYETIQEYVFDEEEINLDLIVFFGNRYNSQVNYDIARGSVKKAIFINDENPDNDNLVKWKWTLPEVQYFENNVVSSKKNPIKVKNEEFDNLTEKFVNYVDKIEKQYRINLEFIYPYFSYLYSIVILSENSRLNNKVEDLCDRFEAVVKSRLGQEFSSFGQDPDPVVDELILIYKEALVQLNFNNNAKSKQLGDIEATDYLLVPSEQTLEVWRHEIRKIRWRKTKVISINKLRKITQKVSVTVLSIKDIDLFKELYGSIHDVQWLLYNAEYKDFLRYKTRYSNELIKEFRSADRKKLIGIDYPHEEEDEIVSDLISRIIEKPKVSGLPDIHLSEYDHIEKKIIFTDNTEIVRSINSSLVWLDKKNNDKALKYLVGDLRPNDTVRVYENYHKEKLFEILSESDELGEFKKILNYSDLWKKLLKEYCNDEVKFEEIASKCNVAISTVKSWLKNKSETRFPQELDGLREILAEDFNAISKSKENYGSITIAIGRDLADDVTDYIISKGMTIGSTLEHFDLPTIKTITEHNMPIKTIKSIQTEDTESEYNKPIRTIEK